jgi:hypothetical protein
MRSPDPGRPEDRLVGIRSTEIDVLFLAYDSATEDPIMLVKRFTS